MKLEFVNASLLDLENAILAGYSFSLLDVTKECGTNLYDIFEADRIGDVHYLVRDMIKNP